MQSHSHSNAYLNAIKLTLFCTFFPNNHKSLQMGRNFGKIQSGVADVRWIVEEGQSE
jgi:hypothetical protein